MFVGATQDAVLIISGSAPMHQLGPVTHHMLLHIALMNLLAPAIAVVWSRSARIAPASGQHLALVSTIQITLIWAAHVPLVLSATLNNQSVHFIGMMVLFVTALWFWTRVLSVNGTQRWQAIVALLITGKLFCLLGIIIAFAPRPIYGAGISLNDQQFAGLLMTAACPLSFVTAGVVLAVKWMNDLRLAGPTPVERLR